MAHPLRALPTSTTIFHLDTFLNPQEEQINVLYFWDFSCCTRIVLTLLCNHYLWIYNKHLSKSPSESHEFHSLSSWHKSRCLWLSKGFVWVWVSGIPTSKQSQTKSQERLYHSQAYPNIWVSKSNNNFLKFQCKDAFPLYYKILMINGSAKG